MMFEKECPKPVGKVLRGLLEQNDMSRTRLANQSGVQRITISRILNGHSIITTSMDKVLSTIFKVKIGYFLGIEKAWDDWHDNHEYKVEERSMTKDEKIQALADVESELVDLQNEFKKESDDINEMRLEKMIERSEDILNELRGV